MILPLIVLLLAALAIAVTFILVKHTRSQTARVLTVVACVFILWDLAELYFNQETAVEIQTDFSDGVQDGLNQDGANQDKAQE